MLSSFSFISLSSSWTPSSLQRWSWPITSLKMMWQRKDSLITCKMSDNVRITLCMPGHGQMCAQHGQKGNSTQTKLKVTFPNPLFPLRVRTMYWHLHPQWTKWNQGSCHRRSLWVSHFQPWDFQVSFQQPPCLTPFRWISVTWKHRIDVKRDLQNPGAWIWIPSLPFTLYVILGKLLYEYAP